MSRQVVLVTGGAQRIGAAISGAFHAAGYQVLIHCNQSRPAADRLAERFNESRAGSAAVMAFDLSHTGQLEDYIADCTRQFNGLDVLVNNASVFYPTPLGTISPAEIQAVMKVNLEAPLMLAKAAAPVLNEASSPGGSVINITDIHAHQPLSGYTPYVASKAALAMVTRNLALELAPNVRVNAIAPGAILWPEETAALDEEGQADLLEGIPLGRLGEPADIANLAVFLAVRGSYITGQVISVAGGNNLH